MKKFLSFVLAVAMSFSCVGVLSGCSGSSSESEEEASVSVVEEEAVEDTSVSVEEEEDSSASSDDGYEELTWPVNEMASVLPEPPSIRGEVDYEYSAETAITIADMTEDDYNDYIEALIAAGFGNSVRQGNIDFYGFDDTGYEVELFYHSSQEEVSITLIRYEYDLDNVSEEIYDLMNQFIELVETYIDLEERYDNYDGTDETLAEDVEDLQAAYDEFSNKLSSLNEDDLTVDELTYVDYIYERYNFLVE